MKEQKKTVVELQAAYQQWIEKLESDAQTRRQAALAKVTSADGVRAWAADLRAWFRGAVGPLPVAVAPCQPERTGVVERDGYRVEKWVFETLPGTLTSSNLYVPAKVNPLGLAICAPLGHWHEGKSNKDHQQMAGFMALHGIPVLVYDHAGVGERREYISRLTGLSATGKSPTDEHNHTGALAALAGIPPCRFFIAEAARAFEFLASFPFVNRSRIGFTGASGGGTVSVLAATVLDEAAFCVPVCIIGGENAGEGAGDAEQHRPEAGLRGVAAVDLLASLVPRPAMIVRERGFEDTARSVATLRRLYELAGAPQAAGYFAIDDVHGYTHPMTEAVYAFLAANFGLPGADRNAWNRVRTLPEKETWCVPSGFLVRDRPQVTLQEQIARLASEPAGLSRERLAALLGLADWQRAPVPYAFTGEVADTVHVTGVCASRPGELGLMAWRDDKPADYWGPGQGALHRSAEAGEFRGLLDFGRSVAGLRVRQILDFLEDHRGKVGELAGEGEWSVPVAIACALAPAELLPRASVRYLPGCFRDHLLAALNTTARAAYVPGLLAAGDMDDIVALCGGRLVITHRVDADGRVVKE